LIDRVQALEARLQVSQAALQISQDFTKELSRRLDRFERNSAEGVDGAAYGPKSHQNFLMVLRSRRCPATLTSGAT